MKRMILAATALGALSGFAAVDLATPFTDNMVLQRGMRVPVWGTADAGAKVTVTFHGQTKTTVAGKKGAWRVDLDPMPASSENRDLKVVGESDNPTILHNVLVGEVWLASGQSNMECPITGGNTRYRDGKGALMTQMIRRPGIRWAHVDRKRAKAPRLDWKERWFDCSPKSFQTRQFSAVAFYFAREVHDALGIPVGIVDVSWGGSRIEPWTPPAGQNWNGMVAAWTPMAIRGFIWYQGCSNASDGRAYKDKMHALYDGWAKGFENPNLKMYFAELAPFKSRWFNLQLAQAAFADEEKNAGMVTTCDVGNWSDIHPNDKETVGQRLAALALRRDYGFADMVADAPTVKSWRVDGTNRFAVAFNHATGFYVYNPDGSQPKGFEMAGADGVFHPAVVANPNRRGNFVGGELLVSCDKVPAPRRLRYLAKPPYVGSLYATDSALPVGPFEIDASEPTDGRRALAKLGDALKIPELALFRTVLAVNLPEAKPSAENAFDAKAAGSFSRVAYVLELVSPKGYADYAVAIMDAFSTADKLGLPCATGAKFQQRVGRLTVRSNLSRVKEVTEAEGGAIEFFNTNYATACGLANLGGDAKRYDFNDRADAANGGYGCLQIHNAADKATVLALSHFNGGVLDIGLGTNPDENGNPDWTFASNAADYTVRRLTVLVK